MRWSPTFMVSERTGRGLRRGKEDSNGIGSHFIDSHHVQRLTILSDSFLNEGRICRKGFAYQILYRTITPVQPEKCEKPNGPPEF